MDTARMIADMLILLVSFCAAPPPFCATRVKWLLCYMSPTKVCRSTTHGTLLLPLSQLSCRLLGTLTDCKTDCKNLMCRTKGAGQYSLFTVRAHTYFVEQ